MNDRLIGLSGKNSTGDDIIIMVNSYTSARHSLEISPQDSSFVIDFFIS